MSLAARGVQLVCSDSQLNSSRVAESFKEYSGFMSFLGPATQGQLRRYSIVRLLVVTTQGQLWRHSTNVRFSLLITQGQLSMQTLTPAIDNKAYFSSTQGQFRAMRHVLGSSVLFL
jgi:hypothetical protein